MEYTNVQYTKDPMFPDGDNAGIKFTKNGEVWEVSINALDNSDYQEIMLQVDAGTLTIADADQYEHSGVRETICKA